MKLHQTLLCWYDKNRRSFPWRERVFESVEEHAYHTWVCEVMSQQTLLSVLLPQYQQFVHELPNVDALYRCSEEKLRSLWKGLGYYARARNLQKGARYIVLECGGVFPKTQAEWERVPGCGAYTSSMVASICFGEKIVAVDGNVIRVGSRLQNMQDLAVWTQSGHQKIFHFFQNQTSDSRAGDFNQALMDLGAMVCKKYEPNCLVCPLQNDCLAYKSNTTALCPPTRPRQTKIDKKIYALVLQSTKNNHQVCILERAHGFLKKTIGFPLCEVKEDLPREEMQLQINKYARDSNILTKTFRHSITRNNITGHVVSVELDEDKISVQEFLNMFGVSAPVQWIDKKSLENHLSSSLDQKVCRIFLEKGSSTSAKLSTQ